ncbi:hypothetical protein ES703_15484 [subsurface metagenome]
MEGKFNYEKLHKYPHLLGEDKIIWSRFIDSFPNRFDTVDYDIHVGRGISSPNETSKDLTEQWRQLTMKRIDVVGWKNQQPTIIEVKKRVGLDTVGQILGYRILYKKEYPDYPSPALLIVCGSIGPDDILVLNEFHIPFEVIEI